MGDPELTFSLCFFFVLLNCKGCTLLFYETYGRNSMEQSSLPRYALFAEDSIVQSVPEHPKKENVFCLSNSFGDVYLFQVTVCIRNFVVVSILECIYEYDFRYMVLHQLAQSIMVQIEKEQRSQICKTLSVHDCYKLLKNRLFYQFLLHLLAFHP